MREVAEVAKLNTRPSMAERRVRATGPLTSSAQPSGRTHAGGTGYQRSDLTQLFLLLTTSFYGEDTYYETANQQVDRLRELVSRVAVNDEGWTWLKGFLPWLRTEANIRTGAIALALEAVKARLDADSRTMPQLSWNGDGRRQLVAAVLQRADEPGEALAYWLGRFGKPVPMPVKRGLADAANRLYSERGYLRYDSENRGVRFADVIELCRPNGAPQADFYDHLPPDLSEAEFDARVRRFKEQRGRLFKWVITERHGRADAEPPAELRSVRARWELNHLSPERRHELASEALRGDLTDAEPGAQAVNSAMAGQWEWVQSSLGDTAGVAAGKAVSKLDRWRLVLPKMGYMALLRNLRNLDQDGLPDAEARAVMDRLTDPAEVNKSRQLPFRFYSAYAELAGLRWGHALETALNHSLVNVPELSGRTLILIDTSDSMRNKLSGKTTMNRVKAAALFAFALALKQDGRVDVYGFADGQFKVDGIRTGSSILRSLEVFERSVGRVGHGTRIEDAVRAQFKAGQHDRVVIFTDMQTFTTGGYDFYNRGNVAAAVPAEVPVFGFNLAGYEKSAMPVGTGNRHELGGLTDHTFGLIKQLEAAQTGRWPWETSV